MTNEEVKNFYKEDERLYDLNENKKFLIMFNRLIDEGYDILMGVKEMQNLIDRLFNWYEIKFPEKEFDFYDGKLTRDFSKFNELSNQMDLRQLFFRLSDNQIRFLDGGYRSLSEKNFPIYDGDKIIDYSRKVYYKINRKPNDKFYEKYSSFIVGADAYDGVIDTDYEIQKYVEEENFDLEFLNAELSQKYSDCLDFSSLTKAINNKFFDDYLRRQILEFVMLKLLYSKNTTISRGYERARRFKEEFNKKLGLDLSMEKLDKIINRDYSVDKDKVKKLSI